MVHIHRRDYGPFSMRRCFRFQQQRHHKMLLFNHFFMHKAEPSWRYFPSPPSSSLKKPFFIICFFFLASCLSFYIFFLAKNDIKRHTCVSRYGYCPRRRRRPHRISPNSNFIHSQNVFVFFLFCCIFIFRCPRIYKTQQHQNDGWIKFLFLFLFHTLGLCVGGFLSVFLLHLRMQLFRHSFTASPCVLVGAYVLDFYLDFNSFRLFWFSRFFCLYFCFCFFFSFVRLLSVLFSDVFPFMSYSLLSRAKRHTHQTQPEKARTQLLNWWELLRTYGNSTENVTRIQRVYLIIFIIFIIF